MLPYHQSLIIIPTYNENKNIARLIETLFSLYRQIHLLIIDDGSPDGTGQIVKDLQKVYGPQLHLIEREGKLGLGTAYVTGFKWALAQKDPLHFEYIFEMDADFSHDPKDISNFLEAAKDNDLVIGSRYVDGIRVINWPMGRLLLSFFASIYTRIITGMPLLDATGGFKCFRRRALESLDLNKIFSNGYSFQIELNFKIWSKKLAIKEIPIIFYERRNGQSKMSSQIVREAVFAVFKLRFKKILGLL